MGIFKSKWFLLVVGLVAGVAFYPQLKPHWDKLMSNFKKS